MSTPDRKDKRAVVLRRIIYLKRRCNRCYLVNVFSSLVNVIVRGVAWFEKTELTSSDHDLYYRTTMFVASAAIMLVGSLFSLYAMTKKLKWGLFLLGHLMMTIAVLLAAGVVLMKFVMVVDTERNYGYPQIYIEDCEAYPDHTFKFILTPESRRGRPFVENLNPIEVEETPPGEQEDVEITTEKVTYETYHCPTMLADIQLFKVIYYMMWSFLIVTAVTVTLSYLGILHLMCLTQSSHLILHPWIVEPYQDYDDVLVHVQMKDEGDPLQEPNQQELELKRHEFEQMNVDMEFIV